VLTGAVVTWLVTGFPDLTTEGEVPHGSSNRRRLHDRGARRARHRDRAVQLHAAADGRGAWIVSDHPSRLFTRNQAITAMVLAERLAAGYGDDDPFVIGWREELGL
jgi:hypothetical protein